MSRRDWGREPWRSQGPQVSKATKAESWWGHRRDEPDGDSVSISAGAAQPVGRRKPRPLQTAPDVDLSEVIVEFMQDGRYVRCAAVCTKTGTEAVVVGTVDMSERQLEQAAIRKLEYVLRKRKGGQKGGFVA